MHNTNSNIPSALLTTLVVQRSVTIYRQNAQAKDMRKFSHGQLGNPP